MARLEESVASHLGDQMLSGRAGSWTAADQATLSAWAIKTVMVLEFAATGGRSPFFTDMERWLFMDRLEPPLNDLKVWAAAYAGDSPIAYHTARVRLRWPATGRDVADVSIATVAVGRIALQVAARRFFEPRPHIDEVVFPPEASRWQGVTVPLWPTSELPRPWPPERSLDAAGLQDFSSRWNDMRVEV
jgi:hypothetical protein